MKKYDFRLAKKIIDKMADLAVLEEASLGMHEDWFWTAETVWQDDEYTVNLNENTMIGGINKSHWATPVLELITVEGKTMTFNCFKGDGKTSVEDVFKQMNIWSSGPLSGPVQDERYKQDLLDYEE